MLPSWIALLVSTFPLTVLKEKKSGEQEILD